MDFLDVDTETFHVRDESDQQLTDTEKVHVSRSKVT